MYFKVTVFAAIAALYCFTISQAFPCLQMCGPVCCDWLGHRRAFSDASHVAATGPPELLAFQPEIHSPPTLTARSDNKKQCWVETLFHGNYFKADCAKVCAASGVVSAEITFTPEEIKRMKPAPADYCWTEIQVAPFFTLVECTLLCGDLDKYAIPD